MAATGTRKPSTPRPSEGPKGDHGFLTVPVPLRGVTLALLGRGAEAIREGERGKTLGLKKRDAYSDPYFDQLLARIYMMSGKPEMAVDVLERILHEPYFLTPAWLRIDPTFAPLRGNARFERLVAGGKSVA